MQNDPLNPCHTDPSWSPLISGVCCQWRRTYTNSLQSNLRITQIMGQNTTKLLLLFMSANRERSWKFTRSISLRENLTHCETHTHTHYLQHVTYTHSLTVERWGRGCEPLGGLNSMVYSTALMHHRMCSGVNSGSHCTGTGLSGGAGCSRGGGPTLSQTR